MTKQNAIETVTSYFEEIDTRALVLDLKTTKDAEADYEAAKYLFGDQDPESETLNNHEDLLEENEKLLIKYYKKQPEEFFAEWNEGNLLLIMARDLKSITSKITKSGLNITEILERTKRIYGNVRDRYFDGDRTEDIVWFLNFITSGLFELSVFRIPCFKQSNLSPSSNPYIYLHSSTKGFIEKEFFS